MVGKFILAAEASPDPLDWGRRTWVCHPPEVGAKQVAIVQAVFSKGKGHNFHKHPHQEEVIFVVSGTNEQWVDRKKQVLRPGDAAFIPPDTAHASFNVGDGEAKILAIFAPSIGDGFEVIEVAHEAPWNTLRS